MLFIERRQDGQQIRQALDGLGQVPISLRSQSQTQFSLTPQIGAATQGRIIDERGVLSAGFGGQAFSERLVCSGELRAFHPRTGHLRPWTLLVRGDRESVPLGMKNYPP
ncbi:hypothetical protein, partial [Nonomuraea recticatena]|uniref:hypothetical protein n=1 Tax=Nonomuraea recticatena TaxID=46178 RepID=UPI0031F755BA